MSFSELSLIILILYIIFYFLLHNLIFHKRDQYQKIADNLDIFLLLYTYLHFSGVK